MLYQENTHSFVDPHAEFNFLDSKGFTIIVSIEEKRVSDKCIIVKYIQER